MKKKILFMLLPALMAISAGTALPTAVFASEGNSKNTKELFNPDSAEVDHTWGQFENPEATWDKASQTLTIEIKAQSEWQWGNQVFFSTGITTLDTSKEYQFSFTATASTDNCGGVTFLAFDSNILVSSYQNLPFTTTPYNYVSEWATPLATSTNGHIVFDFGWDPAQTVTITNISIKERSKVVSYTIADILTTVEGGFPSSSDGNAPSNAWVNSNNEKMFSCEGDLYVGGESDGDFVLSANTELTKDGNNYKCTKDGATVTFIMDDDALTSISIEGLADDAKLNGTYTAPAVWPADAPTEAPAAPTYDGASLLGAALTTNLEFEPLDWPGSMPEKLTFETGETIYFLDQMNWQIYTNWAEDSYDMSEYDTLHVDLFPVTDTRIIVEIEGLSSDDGGQGYKNSVEKTLTAGEWNGLDIALSEFPALSSGKIYDFTDVRYFTLVGDYYNQTALSVGNVYFYKAPHVHAIKTTHAKVEAKCVEAGHEAYYECDCGKYFSNQALTQEIENLETWLGKNGDGYIAPIGHDIDKVNGTPATEDSDGFKDAYKCNRCGKYFEDEQGTKSIGDETAYNAWKLAGGKIGKLSHDIVKVSGSPATADSDGFKDAYKCKNCGKYFEDKEGTKSIGDETAYDAWKVGEGKIPALNPNNGKSANGGAIAGIIIGSFFGLLLIAFIVLYILWKLKDIRIPFLEKILTPAYRWINNLLFKTKLNNVEKKDAEEKHMSDEDYLKAQK